MSLTTTIQNCEKYNGWANRQTWVVFSWLENDSQDLMLAWAKEYVQQCTENNAAAIDSLACRIREMQENLAVDQVNADSVLCDLLLGAFDAVSWREIAKHYIDAV